jgi:hypothetical protein
MIKYDSEKGMFSVDGNGTRLMAEMTALIARFCFALESEGVSAKEIWEDLRDFTSFVLCDEARLKEAKKLHEADSVTIEINRDAFGGQ